VSPIVDKCTGTNLFPGLKGHNLSHFSFPFLLLPRATHSVLLFICLFSTTNKNVPLCSFVRIPLFHNSSNFAPSFLPQLPHVHNTYKLFSTEKAAQQYTVYLNHHNDIVTSHSPHSLNLLHSPDANICYNKTHTKRKKHASLSEILWVPELARPRL